MLLGCSVEVFPKFLAQHPVPAIFGLRWFEQGDKAAVFSHGPPGDVSSGVDREKFVKGPLATLLVYLDPAGLAKRIVALCAPSRRAAEAAFLAGHGVLDAREGVRAEDGGV